MMLWVSLLAVRASEPREPVIEAGFHRPPDEARPRFFWRVFGPAWEPAEIDYQLRLLREGGIGGVTAFFMYPVALDGAGVHNQRFLSEEFLRTFGYAAARAKELGLRFGVAGGTGWPFGGPSVMQFEAAQQLRQIVLEQPAAGEPLKLPSLHPGEQLLAVFAGGTEVELDPVTNLSLLPSHPTAGPVTAYITGPTYMRVKRPALGAEGLVLDHYQAAAAKHYLAQVVDPLLNAAPGKVESVFCDSLEVYHGNWTADFPQEFLKRRGYALRPNLQALFDQQLPHSQEVRFDYWRTLAELTEDRFTRVVSEWSHHRSVRLEMEAYGTPPNPLTAARYIDVPTGEQYEWRGFSLSRLAASGAHLAGKNVVGAEAWTWLGLPNRLGDSLSDIKLATDLHFLCGINDLTGVDFAYSPRSQGAPGWLPYYGPVFNQNNPQWPWFHYLADYLSRCEWLLRQGRPVADVAVYLPVEDIFASGPVDQMLLGFHLRDHFVSGEKTGEFGLQTALRHRSDLLHGLLMQGLDYDGIDFFSMNRLVTVRHGHLVAGQGDYITLVLPRLVGMEVQALQKALDFARSGGMVIITGRLPERVYGAREGKNRRSPASLLRQLVGETPDTSRGWNKSYGEGCIAFVPDEQEGFAQALQSVRSEVRLIPPQPEVGLIHRRTRSLDIFFFANTSETNCDFQADIVSSHPEAELWDPMTGQTARVQRLEGSTRIQMHLPPRGSTFVVFRDRANATPPPVRDSQVEEPQASWTLTFSGTNAPAPRTTPQLTFWTDWPDTQFFSGCGTYATTFVWNHPAPRHACLELAEVREAAEIRINGQLAGPLWIPPFEVDISRWLVPGTNTVTITAANVPLNLFLGTPDEDLARLRAVFGDRFPAPEEKRVVGKAAPSGVRGPMRLRFDVLPGAGSSRQ